MAVIYLKSEFQFGDHVRIDGGDVIGVVTTISFSGVLEASYEITWFQNGTVQTTWCRAHRLEKKQ